MLRPSLALISPERFLSPRSSLIPPINGEEILDLTRTSPRAPPDLGSCAPGAQTLTKQLQAKGGSIRRHEMSPSHSRHSSELSPELPDDLVLDILLRFPPDRPEFLARASCVSKAWRRALSDPAFCRSYRDFHRTPPLLGFVSHELWDDQPRSRFVPTTAFRAPTMAPRSHWQLVKSACHGRVILKDIQGSHNDLIVWDPMTGDEHSVPLRSPSLHMGVAYYAVLCAAVGCSHRSCHGGPFFVVRVCRGSTTASHARVYSSEDGTWGDMTSVEHPDAAFLQLASVVTQNSALLGSTVYVPWLNIITGYNMDDRQLSVFEVPPAHNNQDSCILMTAEDGTLGFAGVQESKLLLWSRKAAGRDGAMAWTQDRVIDLKAMLPIRGFSTDTDVVGFADGVAVIFIRTDVGLFTFELSSGRVHKVSRRVAGPIVPYTSFYTLDYATRRLPTP